MANSWTRWIPYGVIAVLALLLLMMVFGSFLGTFSSQRALSSGGYAENAYDYDQAMADFAPDVEEREIAKTATLSTEIQRGTFEQRSLQLRSIVDVAQGFILNENIREVRDARRGDYSIKVPADSYDSVTQQLKDLGDVESFTENARDVTGQYVNADIELEVEQERLARLQTLYDERGGLDDKLRLEKAIFDQERKIKYLEESLERLDQRVTYSTLSVSLYEKENALADVGFVRFAELVRTFISSLQLLLYFLFAVLPWAFIAALGLLVYRFIKRRPKN